MAEFNISIYKKDTFNWDNFSEMPAKAYTNGYFIYNTINVDIKSKTKVSVDSIVGYLLPASGDYIYYFRLERSETLDIVDILNSVITMDVSTISENDITFSLKSPDSFLANDVPIAQIIFTNNQMPISINDKYGATGGATGGSLTVGEIDGAPIGSNISKIIFNGTTEVISISGSTAYVNATTPPAALGCMLSLSRTTLSK
jgi:hypothetical protein